MNTTHETLKEKFSAVGKNFSKTCVQGFCSRKPKKIMSHTKRTLRYYRNDAMDLFDQLTGTILIWRYAMIAQIPKKESRKIEQSILRSFNYILNKVVYDRVEEVRHLTHETTPARSAMGAGNPLRELLDLKILEFLIRFADSFDPEDMDRLERQWRSRFQELSNRFRFRLSFQKALQTFGLQ